MFRDECRIHLRAGDGGRGCASFRREKHDPMGGPDGGDGGSGGDIVLRAVPGENTLLGISKSPNYRAESGEHGRGDYCTGASVEALVLDVPVGTVVKDLESGVILRDLAHAGDEVVVAKGGRGGRGNASFKHALNQSPKRFEEGQKGESRSVLLELKLIADVGLVGLPNAGKSTFITRVSRATPKIANYPFTTLEPHPGIVELRGFRRFVLMDIPGLIEGASLGAGLGHKFLRHVERTRVLVHLVDLFPPEGDRDPATAAKTIIAELERYSPVLAQKPRVLVFNKADIDPEAAADMAGEVAREIGATEWILVSAATGENLEAVLERCWDLLKGAKA